MTTIARTLSDEGADLLFREARTQNGWQDRPVSDETLRQVYDLMKWAPTSANCSPARFLFLRTPAAKERLRPHLDKGNVDKTMAAPVVTVIAYDTRFFEHLPTLFPHAPTARSWFEGKPNEQETAFRNGSLQGAYFILAARAVGLDCGPMSGFNKDGVDREFFPDGRFKANFLCCLGHGDPAALYPRSPRFAFEDVCLLI